MHPVLPRRPSRATSPARGWSRTAIVLVVAIVLGAPLTAEADSTAQPSLSPGLLDAATAQPEATFGVIVTGRLESEALARGIQELSSGSAAVQPFMTVPAVAATLTGSQIVALAGGAEPLVITRDSPVTATDDPPASEEPPPPAPRDEPAVAGDAEPGAWLTVTPPLWTGSGTPSYSYLWQRCGSALGSDAILADSPLDYWSRGELDGDVEVGGPDHGALASRLSFEAWVELDDPQPNQPLLSSWGGSDAEAAGRWGWGGVGGFQLYVDQEGHHALVAGTYQPTYVRTSIGPVPGEREHLVGTWDGAVLRLYRDGVEIGAGELAASTTDAVADMTAGSAVEELAVYDRALTPIEVSGHAAGCLAIPEANGETYRVAADDLGLRVRALVTATGDGTSTVSASRLTPTVAARPPVATAPPSILGTGEEGQTLRAANGSWDGTQPLEFGHQWQRCDVRGEGCVSIDGATEAGYTLGADDVGSTIRLAVSATGLGGHAVARSDPSDAVVGLPRKLQRFKQHWPYASGLASLLSSAEGRNLEPPTIAVVDSGIDAGRADFGGRVIEHVNLSTRAGNQPGDGNGHGTAVASVAAGEAEGYTGAAPDANLVAVEVLDDTGIANTSDVIRAADWIYNHRERLNIRVANFSLHGTTVASLASDPLDKAVERLWLSGIVVVAAAGNYAAGGAESAVPFAPGNDPFVLTVGATDTRGSYTQRDDVAAPWSAWGYTRDGFAKPEVGAPGRYIAAAVSPHTKLARERPERVVEPGYLQLSGTSLAAPVVAGSAANLLAAHPEWTPDQVKGALMLTAEPLPRTPARSVGVGAVSVARAAAVVDPPNPNLALQRFLVPDPRGGPTPVFDAAGWTTTVQSDPAWASVAWGSVAWGSAAWSSVAWGSVAWGSVAWGSVAWGSVAWGSNAEDDVRPEGGYWIRRD